MHIIIFTYAYFRVYFFNSANPSKSGVVLGDHPPPDQSFFRLKIFVATVIG